MAKCIMCGREINEDTHLLIHNQGVELNFYSKNCVNEYIKKAERLISENELPVKELEKEDLQTGKFQKKNLKKEKVF